MSVVLVVEGTRDQQFFAQLVPYADRVNATVIPVSEIEIPPVEGGERGRALWLASELQTDAEVRDRVFFFLDADVDHFLAARYPASVILTDYSDFECYVLNECSIRHMLVVFGGNSDQFVDVKGKLLELCRPIKAARVASHVLGLNLPMNYTLGADARDRFSRYIRGRGLDCTLDQKRLLGAVYSNASIAEDRRRQFERCLASLEGTPLGEEHWAQGKDLTAAVAVVFRVAFQEAARLILSAILACCAAVVRTMPGIGRAEAILRS